MKKEEKVRQYLKLSGYSEEQIKKSISNEQYLNMIYELILTYEEGISTLDIVVNPVENYANLDGRKIK